MGQTVPLLQVEHMCKSFGITKALADVSITLNKGEVLGLIGENGSGKSTLTSIVAALQPMDSGTMFLEGQPYKPRNTVEANELGICMILQEKGTFDRITVANNIFVGKENQFIRHGMLDKKAMIKSAQKALKDIGEENIQAGKVLGTLNFEERKLVEVARAMYSNPRLLIIDETTTALSREGRLILYEIMKKMTAEDKSVIFISHDIDEVMEVCDRLIVLRDGKYIDTLTKENFGASVIRKLMVGRELSENYYRADMESCKNEEVVLSVDGITCRELQDVSFKLHKGEILGFGGLGDCGMHLLGNITFGLTEPDLGTVCAGNGDKITSPKTAMKNRIAYISKNRDQETLMLSSSVKDNICLASYPALKNGPFVKPASEKKFVNQWSNELEIKMQDSKQYVMELSGGNKQKVALAKWLGFGADIFILDCPTRGIDIGVKSNIYQLMEELRDQGKSIIMISEELSEVIGMSDRVIILKDGRVSGEFKREEKLTENLLIEYMV